MAQEWERVYPCVGYEEPVYENRGFPFRESYVEYRFVNNGTELQINILDQVEREGFLPERLWNRWIGPLTSSVRVIHENVLLRILNLLLYIPLTPNASCDYWFCYPNFEVLDTLLMTDKKKLVKYFKGIYIDVKTLHLWVSDQESRLRRPSAISSIRFSEETNIEAWRQAFNDVGVTLN